MIKYTTLQLLVPLIICHNLCLAQSAVEQGKYNLGIEYYTSGLENMNQHNYNTAIEKFNKAIELNQSYADAFTARATAFMKTKNLNGAKNDVNMALGLTQEEADIILSFCQHSLQNERISNGNRALHVGH